MFVMTAYHELADEGSQQMSSNIFFLFFLQSMDVS